MFLVSASFFFSLYFISAHATELYTAIYHWSKQSCWFVLFIKLRQIVSFYLHILTVSGVFVFSYLAMFA